MIRFERVSKRFGRDVLLDGVDLEIQRGSRWGLIGPGASGKTVMLKLMCGLMRPDSGRIFLEGREITAMHEDDMGELRQRVGMLFQNYALFDFMNVAENVAFPLVRRGGVEAPELADRVATRLRAVGLAHAGEKRPSELSGGMKKRVGIARATIARPDLVIYDEPTAGLDPVTTSKIYDLLRADHAESGGTVIAVSSDVEALRGFVDRIAMLYKGRLLYDGPSATIGEAPDPVVKQFVRGLLEGPL